MDTASNSALENEFGTSKEEDVIKKILRGGSPQTKTVCPRHSLLHSTCNTEAALQNPERHGDRNLTDGPWVEH
jgi:hypothetical protein